MYGMLEDCLSADLLARCALCAGQEALPVAIGGGVG